MIAKQKPGLITFPGSNCEKDVERVLRSSYQMEPHYIWHLEPSIPDDISHIIIPGGFSFGDYLRAGALSSLSPIMSAVREFARGGKPVLGICNGFQILCESGLLPGALLRNHHDRFVCKRVNTTWRGARSLCKARTLTLPIAHRDGRYYADNETLATLSRQEQIILSYDDRDEEGCAIVNGSAQGIAGIVGGVQRNVIGLMPHPERMTSPFGDDGIVILDDFLFG